MKKTIAIILTLSLALFLPANNSDAATKKQTDKLLETIIYEAPTSETMDEIVLSSTEANTLSTSEITALIKSRTHFDDTQVQRMLTSVQQAKKAAKTSNTVSLMADHTHSGIPFTSYYENLWTTAPRLTRTEKWLSWNSWIGVDAYRSAVGKSKGTEESISASTTIGFEGFEKILQFCSFSWGQTKTSTSTISSAFTCPAWTTYNERPYIAYYKDYWEGIWSRGLYYVWFDGCVTLQSTDQPSIKQGTNSRLFLSSEELWSRVNDTHNVNLATPMPPTGQPSVSW